MGRYIEEILQPDEKVLYSTTIHWIVYLPAILAWIAAIAFFALSRGRGRGHQHCFGWRCPASRR